MTVALIDGDIVAFRAAAAACRTFNFGDGVVGETADADMAMNAAVTNVEAWTFMAGCKDTLVCFTGTHNFRKVILPSYKANRVKGKPPVYWQTVEAVKERFETRVVHGLEADDLLGILLTRPAYADAVCCTLDKDLRTVPGRHFNPTKDRKPVTVGELRADYWWLLQTLMGDVTDGYSGIPGVGPKKAEAILGPSGRSLSALWPLVLAAYREAGLTAVDALTMARVARILRNSDYDKAKKGIRLWHPTAPTFLDLATVCSTTVPTPRVSTETSPQGPLIP